MHHKAFFKGVCETPIAHGVGSYEDKNIHMTDTHMVTSNHKEWLFL
jgi:hypothetical protein